MAKNETPEVHTAIDDINDSLTKAELKIQNNKNLIKWACIGVVAVVAIVLLFIYAYLRPSQNSANNQYGLASNLAAGYEISANQLDSAANALQLDAVAKAFENAASKGHDGGNNATLMAAIFEFKKGDYNKALSYLDDYSHNDVIVAALSECLKGDCLVNLDKFEEGIKAFESAVNICDENPIIAPYALMKQATVQRHLGNYAAEAQCYEVITKKYPGYAASIKTNIETYLARAKAQAEAAAK